MLPEEQRAAFMDRAIRENSSRATSTLVWLAVLLDGQIIGTHSVSEVVEHQSAVFHAHLWKPELRGQGIATFTYPRAAKIFADRFDLREVLFKTPVGNVAANRIKEKLGLRRAGQTPVEYDFMLPGVMANIYRWPRAAIEAFLAADA
jgi:RimJ/RimL family protein N-acetyltransferase